jgi:hypothetical protein
MPAILENEGREIFNRDYDRSPRYCEAQLPFEVHKMFQLQSGEIIALGMSSHGVTVPILLTRASIWAIKATP